MAKYRVDVLENWHRVYELDAEDEFDAIARAANLPTYNTGYLSQGSTYIDDAASDSWIVERIDDE